MGRTTKGREGGSVGDGEAVVGESGSAEEGGVVLRGRVGEGGTGHRSSSV